MEHQPEPLGQIRLGPGNLKTFIAHQLNIIYTAKGHLVARLPEITGHVDYRDLHDGILKPPVT